MSARLESISQYDPEAVHGFPPKSNKGSARIRSLARNTARAAPICRLSYLESELHLMSRQTTGRAAFGDSKAASGRRDHGRAGSPAWLHHTKRKQTCLQYDRRAHRPISHRREESIRCHSRYEIDNLYPPESPGLSGSC